MKKELPHNIDAEQGLLGILLFDNRKFDAIADLVTVDHFFAPVHARIYQTISRFINQGKDASAITLKGHFDDDPDLQDAGGGEYLSDLAEMVVGTVNLPHYAQTIHDLYLRRRLIMAADDIHAIARNFECEDVLSETENILTGVSDRAIAREVSAGDAALSAEQWIHDIAEGRIKPIKTGYEDLDKVLGGFYPGRLYILAARPGMGKTALALNLADNIARQTPTLFLSLEMTAQELSMRLISSRCGVTMSRQQNPQNLDMEESRMIREAVQDVAQLKLTINDTGGMNLAAVNSFMRRHVRKHGKGPVFIDYLGLMAMDRTINNRVHQIEEITKALKAAAKNMDVPIILLSQLSRALEQREDKRPISADLRDSGAIEQDADAIMFVYREEVYTAREEPRRKTGEDEGKFNMRWAEWEDLMRGVRGKAEIIIDKNRQGRTGRVYMRFDGDKQRFS